MYVFEEKNPNYIYNRRIIFLITSAYSLISGNSESLKTVLAKDFQPYPLAARIPALSQFSDAPYLVLHQDIFNLAPLIRQIKTTAHSLRVPIEDFNRTVVDFSQPIPASAFTSHFSRADCIVGATTTGVKALIILQYKHSSKPDKS